MKKATIKLAVLLSGLLTFGCESSTTTSLETKTEETKKTPIATDTLVKTPESETENDKKPENETKQEIISQDPKKLLAEIKKKRLTPIFHGMGTEPFWDLYILEKSVVLDNQSLEEQQYWELQQPFDKGKTTQKLYLINAKGKKATLLITKEECDDGMSETKFKYSVNFDGLIGCGKI